jgi:hypothetical protein
MSNHCYIKINGMGQSPTAPFWAEEINKAFWDLNTAEPVSPDGRPSVTQARIFNVIQHPDGRDNEVMMHVDLDYKLYCREKGGLGTLNAWCRQNMTPAEADAATDAITNGEEGMFVTVEHFLPDTFQYYTREDLINDGFIVEEEL